jgi:hypothetical protein
LIEIGLADGNDRPELSFGTHFFHDLVETQIHVLAIWPDDNHGSFRWDFFRDAANSLTALSPEDKQLAPYLRVIDIPATSAGHYLHLYMDGQSERAIGYLGTRIK